jgi:hypothetical protein
VYGGSGQEPEVFHSHLAWRLRVTRPYIHSFMPLLGAVLNCLSRDEAVVALPPVALTGTLPPPGSESCAQSGILAALYLIEVQAVVHLIYFHCKDRQEFRVK